MQSVLASSLNWYEAPLTWLALAVVAGLLVVVLPLNWAFALFGMAALGVIIFLEPAIGLVVMLAAAPLKTLLETEDVWTLPLDVGQLAFAIAVGVWLLNRSIQRDALRKLQWSPLYPVLFLYLLVTGFSLPGAYSLGDGLSEWVKWAEIAVLVVIVFDLGRDRWQWLLFGVVFAAVIQALIGLYQFNGGSGAGHLWILDFRYFRAFGTFGQPNPFGGFMGLILPLALGSAWGHAIQTLSLMRSDNHRLWQPSTIIAIGYASFAATILAALVASWSRGAWAGFSAAMLIVMWLAPQRRIVGTLVVIAVLIGGSVLYVEGVFPQSIIDRVLSFSQEFTGFRDVRGAFVDDDNFAIVERLAHWQAALNMGSSRPWLGVGFGNYEAAYSDFNLPHWPLALGHAHNYYLNVLGETGILGLSAYFVLWVTIFGLTWQTLHRASGLERGVAVGLMGTWVHLSIHSLVDKLYVNNVFLHIGVMLGLLAVVYYRTILSSSLQQISED